MRAQEETLQMYQTYGEMVFRICLIHLKNQQDAYDAVQETFLKLMQSEKIFESENHAKAWLITVAGNICKNMLKSFWHKNRVSNDALLLPADDNAEKSEEFSDVMEAVFNLPEKYKDLVYLHYYEGYSIEEIAGIIGKKPSTLRSRLSKAKALLKKYLQEE
ncbi:RNA polymerase sigma factor [bacterium D16-51]|nr:RNA polymerase sigma factor [bacterium D16-59]RKI60616.1 RNA polymerase sigma factor [bacterium D16-51]